MHPGPRRDPPEALHVSPDTRWGDLENGTATGLAKVADLGRHQLLVGNIPVVVGQDEVTVPQIGEVLDPDRLVLWTGEHTCRRFAELVPILIPVILSAVTATGDVFSGATLSEVSDSLVFLGAFAVIFFVIALLTFGYVIEE